MSIAPGRLPRKISDPKGKGNAPDSAARVVGLRLARQPVARKQDPVEFSDELRHKLGRIYGGFSRLALNLLFLPAERVIGMAEVVVNVAVGLLGVLGAGVVAFAAYRQYKL